jgi:hypothetical protein
MKSPKVSINDLRIKATGLTARQAHQLGQLVAQGLLNAQLTGDQRRVIPEQSVRISSSKETSINRLADDIVSRIRQGLD